MSAILLLVSVVIFVLAAFGVEVGDAGSHQVVAAGLACFAGSFLVGPVIAHIEQRRTSA